MKNKNILGIDLNYDYVRDIFPTVDEYMENVIMNTVYIVSMSLLVETEQNPDLKNLIDQMDLRIIGDKEIIKAAGMEDRLLENEIKGQIFLKQLFKKALKYNKTFFLLTQTEEELESMQKLLEKNYGKIMITGAYAKNNCVGDVDLIINEINIASPDIVLVKLPTPEMELFMMEGKEKISAKLCIGFRPEIYMRMHKTSFLYWLKKQLHKSIFHRKVTKYNND